MSLDFNASTRQLMESFFHSLEAGLKLGTYLFVSMWMTFSYCLEQHLMKKVAKEGCMDVQFHV